jgi:hypothetical protein
MLFAQAASPSLDLGAVAKALLGAVKNGDWLAVVAAVLVLVVAGVRLYGQKIRGELPDENWVDKALTWLLESKPGGWTLNVLTAISGAYATALLAGEPITWGITQAALVTALSGAALWELAKDVIGWWATKKAIEAGKAAAAQIQTSGDAVGAVNSRTDKKPF